MTLYIGNLTSRVRHQDLEQAFQRFGRSNLQLKDSYGFVVYEASRDAERALKSLQGKTIGGQRPSIMWARNQNKNTYRNAGEDRPQNRSFWDRGARDRERAARDEDDKGRRDVPKSYSRDRSFPLKDGRERIVKEDSRERFSRENSKEFRNRENSREKTSRDYSRELSRERTSRDVSRERVSRPNSADRDHKHDSRERNSRGSSRSREFAQTEARKSFHGSIPQEQRLGQKAGQDKFSRFVPHADDDSQPRKAYPDNSRVDLEDNREYQRELYDVHDNIGAKTSMSAEWNRETTEKVAEQLQGNSREKDFADDRYDARNISEERVARSDLGDGNPADDPSRVDARGKELSQHDNEGPFLTSEPRVRDPAKRDRGGTPIDENVPTDHLEVDKAAEKSSSENSKEELLEAKYRRWRASRSNSEDRIFEEEAWRKDSRRENKEYAHEDLSPEPFREKNAAGNVTENFEDRYVGGDIQQGVEDRSAGDVIQGKVGVETWSEKDQVMEYPRDNRDEKAEYIGGQLHVQEASGLGNEEPGDMNFRDELMRERIGMNRTVEVPFRGHSPEREYRGNRRNSDQERRGLKFPGKVQEGCFSCGQLGHIMRHCPTRAAQGRMTAVERFRNEGNDRGRGRDRDRGLRNNDLRRGGMGDMRKEYIGRWTNGRRMPNELQGNFGRMSRDVIKQLPANGAGRNNRRWRESLSPDRERNNMHGSKGYREQSSPEGRRERMSKFSNRRSPFHSPSHRKPASHSRSVSRSPSRSVSRVSRSRSPISPRKSSRFQSHSPVSNKSHSRSRSLSSRSRKLASSVQNQIQRGSGSRSQSRSPPFSHRRTALSPIQSPRRRRKSLSAEGPRSPRSGSGLHPDMSQEQGLNHSSFKERREVTGAETGERFPGRELSGRLSMKNDHFDGELEDGFRTNSEMPRDPSTNVLLRLGEKKPVSGRKSKFSDSLENPIVKRPKVDDRDLSVDTGKNRETRLRRIDDESYDLDVTVDRTRGRDSRDTNLRMKDRFSDLDGRRRIQNEMASRDGTDQREVGRNLPSVNEMDGAEFRSEDRYGEGSQSSKYMGQKALVLDKNFRGQEKRHLWGEIKDGSRMDSKHKKRSDWPGTSSNHERKGEIGNTNLLNGNSSASFGAARFWPAQTILVRRHQKGPITSANIQRRTEQNKSFSINDTRIRSASGWFEKDFTEHCPEEAPMCCN